MKIRTKFTLIIVVVTIILALSLSIANLVFDFAQQSNYLKFANEHINSFTKWNNEQAQKNLGPFAENYIQLLAKDLGYIVRRDFLDNNNDYTYLKGNKKLRKILLDSTYLNGLQVGYAALVERDDSIILSSDLSDEGIDVRSWILRSEITISENLYAINNAESFNFYFQYFPDDTPGVPDNEYASAFKIPDTELVLIYSLSLDDYMQPINDELSKKRGLEARRILDKINLAFEEDRIYSLIFSLVSLIIIYLFSIPLIMWFSKSITEPIRKLRDEVLKLGRGQFNISLKVQGSDEIRDLLGSMNYLGSELSQYTENLKTEIMQRQRIETEIDIAHRIQETTLPKIGSDFVFNGFELGVKLLPADKVAGDFYEFFYCGDKLALAVADVSGKGISAAFFMSISKAIMHNSLLQYNEPDVALTEVNRLLSMRNDTNMFATVFVGFFDPDSSTFTFSNAGHENVLLVKADGSITEIGQHERPPVGFFSDSTYRSEIVKLEKNDVMIFYTDGITEARSPAKEFFGLDNLKKLIESNISLNPQDLCDFIVDKVNDFEDGRLYDDVTIMIFKKV